MLDDTDRIDIMTEILNKFLVQWRRSLDGIWRKGKKKFFMQSPGNWCLAIPCKLLHRTSSSANGRIMFTIYYKKKRRLDRLKVKNHVWIWCMDVHSVWLEKHKFVFGQVFIVGASDRLRYDQVCLFLKCSSHKKGRLSGWTPSLSCSWQKWNSTGLWSCFWQR